MEQLFSRSFVIELFLLIINLGACLNFVVGTYIQTEEAKRVFYLVEIVFALIFTLEYAIRFRQAQNKRRYVFSFFSFVDIITILPVFLPVANTGFMRILKVFRILRFAKMFEESSFFSNSFSVLGLQIGKVAFTIIIIVFIFSGSIYYVESHNAASLIKTWGDSLYFTVITLSTVGYGDITPSYELSRWLTVAMIFCGIIFIPWQTGKLIRYLLIMESGKIGVICSRSGLSRHDRDAVYCKACGMQIYQEFEGS
jgi:voltage-gated potassium channel